MVVLSQGLGEAKNTTEMNEAHDRRMEFRSRRQRAAANQPHSNETLSRKRTRKTKVVPHQE